MRRTVNKSKTIHFSDKVSIKDEEDELNEKKQALEKKFKLHKEEYTYDDLAVIISSLNIDKEQVEYKAKEIFDKLDKQQIGLIKKEDFLERIVLNKSDPDFQIFYAKLKDDLLSNSEQIIRKLKKIKEKAYFNHDNETIEDINWIIETVSEDNLHEVGQTNEELNSFQNDPGFKYFMKYSQMEGIKLKENDIQVINNFRRGVTVSNIRTKSSFYQPTKEFKFNNINAKERKSIQLSSFISPSLLAKLTNKLYHVDSYDFNIFEIDELVQKETTFYISYEIFTRLDYFNEEIIDEEKFKRFTHEIIKGYDRNIAYHNDLHAGDVLQTFFVMLTNGNLEEVLHL